VTVIKQSPAFQADFLTGDVITRVASQDVADGKSLVEIITQNAGQRVEIEFIRNGETRLRALKLRNLAN